MSDEGQKEEEYVLRDQVIMFSTKLSHSGHNIKDYRKRQLQKGKRTQGVIPNSTQCTYPDNNFIHTIDLSERPSDPRNSQQRIKFSLDKMPSKRVSITAGNTRRKMMHQQNMKTQIKLSEMNKSLDARGDKNVTGEKLQFFREKQKQKAKGNKFTAIEKKINKGPLKQKHMECWLNSVLLQACFEEKFDMTIENPALKKFSLDRNSLLSKGIKVTNLNRLYKSLFVYSIGFNNLLKEICESNMNLRKTLWKVYAILLQVCAQGQFQMMLAEIQRDKTRQFELMKGQISQRQKIIENNEQINEQRNARVFKQVKVLKQENQNLQNEKQILLEEYKQAQQAFNEEVTLRLRFQNRINEIHGVYTQMKAKHQRLGISLDKKIDQAQKLSIIATQQSKELSKNKFELEQKTAYIQQLQKEIKGNNQSLTILENNKINSMNENITSKNRLLQLNSIIAENKRVIQQNEANLQNSKLLYENEKQEHVITRNLFQKSLKQNSQMHLTIQDQMKQLNVLMLEKRDFGLITSEVEAGTVLVNKKLQQKTEQNKQLQGKYEELQAKYEKTKNKFKYEKEMKQKLQQSIKECFESITKMRQAKNALEEDLESKAKKIQIIDEILDSKDKDIYEKSKKIQQLMEENSQNVLLIKTQQSKISMLTQKLNSEMDIADKKFKKVKEERDKLEKQFSEFDNVKNKLQLQMEKYKKLYEQTTLGFKNQKFQRTNLDLRYKQSLNVMQSENQHIRQLNIKISELNEQIMSQNRKINSTQYVFAEKQKQFNKDRKFWENQINLLKKQNKEKKQFMNPMAFEDVAAKYHQVNELFKNSEEKYGKIVAEEKKKAKQAQSKLEYTVNKNKTQMAKKQKQHLKILQKKQHQIQYAEEKVDHLVYKNKEMEDIIGQNNLGGGNKLLSRQEQNYMNIIKEKTKMVQDLLKQVEKAHDEYNQLKQTYNHFEIRLKEKNEEIQRLAEEYEKCRMEIKSHNVEKQEMKKKITQAQLALATNMEGIMKSQQNKKRQQSAVSRSGKSKRKYDKNTIDKTLDNDTIDEKRNDFVRKYKGAYVYYNNK